MTEYSRKEPAENIILLDDIRPQSKIAGVGEQFPAVNHGQPPPTSFSESRGARP